jgi:hypothetical protein
VATGLDVVSIGIEHERPIVIFVVVRTKSGGPIVATSCRQGGTVESVHQRAVVCPERDVKSRCLRATLVNPEVRLMRHSEA